MATLFFIIDRSGKQVDVAAYLDQLTFEAARTAPPPFNPPRLEPGHPKFFDDMAEAKAKHDKAVEAHYADCEIERGAFNHALALCKAGVAIYPPDSHVGVHARRQESPPGSGSMELTISVAEHPPLEVAVPGRGRIAG
jgi:hypothetical protein